MPRPRILSVGQCGFDHAGLARFAEKHLNADLVAAATSTDALEALRRETFDLVLVNRVGDRDGRPGLDLIRALKADESLASIPAMLVSNYADAQAEAVTAGALPGFGKAEVGRPELASRIKSVLEAS